MCFENRRPKQKYCRSPNVKHFALIATTFPSFVFEMTSCTTASIKCTIEQTSQIFYKTHIAYLLVLIHFACCSSLQFINDPRKHTTALLHNTKLLYWRCYTICLSWSPASLQELQFPIRRVIQKTSVLLKLSNFTFAEFFTSPAKIWCWKPQIITRLELVALFYWKSLTEH